MSEFWIDNDKEVKGFRAEFQFLSNFSPAQVCFEGLWYNYSENAYQAAKLQTKYRHLFTDVKPAIAKKEWKEYPRLYSDTEWNSIKYDIMSGIVWAKNI